MTRTLGRRPRRLAIAGLFAATVASVPVVAPTAVAAAPTTLHRTAPAPAPGTSESDFTFLMSVPAPEYVARWDPCRVIGYRVNLNAAPPGALADVQEAIARLRAATGLDLAYRGTTSIVPRTDGDPYPHDTQIIIAWAPPGMSDILPAQDAVGAEGVGGLQVTESTGAHRRRHWRGDLGYVILNTRYNALTPGFGSGPRDGLQGTRGRLLLHELGHAVGLSHARQPDEIMYPSNVDGAATWGPGDLAGLRQVGRTAGCIPG